MKRMMIVLAMLMAIVVPGKAQDWKKTKDGEYLRYTTHADGVVVDHADPVIVNQLVAELNNDMRSAALCQFGCMGTAALAGGAALLSAKNGGDAPVLNASAIVFGVGSLAFGIASIVKLNQKRVYIGPDGVIIRLSKTDYPNGTKKLSERNSLFGD